MKASKHHSFFLTPHFYAHCCTGYLAGMLHQKHQLSVYHQHILHRLLHPVSSEVLLLCSPTINTKLMVIHSKIITQFQKQREKARQSLVFVSY